jgi:hypothetical protein
MNQPTSATTPMQPRRFMTANAPHERRGHPRLSLALYPSRALDAVVRRRKAIKVPGEYLDMHESPSCPAVAGRP